ncbi:apolipoprotein N-acyltransferase [Corynebacterium sp. 320]|nr:MULTISPECIES: apolipoprotein N-acyltransferase [Corynebacterium]KAB1553280.1 apolipoprotein N-acyltransferase [Corynebacterium sp. 321]KAB1553501.1 apolipoprotein N-acyltransferase [Corynebacterium sp. 319]KAB3540930.1 apolipoprotein N-acyltransferase [Corynebacterium sp. 366]KAB1503619.1 apolipoprotein N-acyltransferase [Corynebacterium sp. 320]KAB3527755.1 apolipoprotein N-acyltransferase [Corynebacterium sp. 250]
MTSKARSQATTRSSAANAHHTTRTSAIALYLLRALAAAFSGVLVFLSFQPAGLWWAAPAGFALLFLIVTPRNARSLACIHGLTLYGFLLPWVGEYVGAIAWIGLALVQSLYSFLFGWGLRSLLGWKKLQHSLLSAGAIAAWFVATEWLRSSWPFGGFAWGRITWGQVGGPLASLISFGGPALVTFAVVLVGALLASLINILMRAATERGHARRHSPFLPSSRPLAPIVALAVIAVISVCAYFSDAVLPETDEQPAASTISIAAIQGNVPRAGLDFNTQRRAVLDNHAAQTGKLAEEVRQGTAPQPDLVLWPENASDINPYVNEDAQTILNSVNHAIGAPILLGTVTPEHNRMVVWTEQQPADTHDKRFLQPFGEYMPLRDLLRHVSPLVDRAGDFKPGHGNGLVHMTPERGEHQGQEIPIGIATCYEVAFDEAFRTSVRAGAQLLTTPTNNATFGFTDMTYQQLAMSRMRAIEYDRAIIVPATSGVSAIVDHDGRVVQKSGLFQPAVLQSSVELRNTITLSAVVGPWVEWIICAAGALCAVLGLFLAEKPRPTRTRVRKRTRRSIHSR